MDELFEKWWYENDLDNTYMENYKPVMLKAFKAGYEANAVKLGCGICKHLEGRHCMLSANHCIRRAEDFYVLNA